MAVHFAFQLGSLAFVVSLIRCAIEGAQFVNGVQSSPLVGFCFFGIGFAVGQLGRLMMEELAAQKLAEESEIQDPERSDLKSPAGVPGQ